jgi:DNA polymerase I-like protein with 3'-5' exonuclease and polymerase domains
MDINYKIISSEEEFFTIVADWPEVIACDTETKGNARSSGAELLGISLSRGSESKSLLPSSLYLPSSVFKTFSNGALASWLLSKRLVGWNFTYDKRWLALSAIPTNWVADGRLMWHLSSAPSGPRSYGLKDAQKDLLGWTESNDKELERHIKSRGGSIKNGDHYLADVEILGKYACLDAYSTMEAFKILAPFFDMYEYWPTLHKMMKYNELLEENTFNGIKVDRTTLEKSHKRLLNVKEAAKKRLDKELYDHISALEYFWADRKIASYKREYNKIWYSKHQEKWARFNWNSDVHKRELFYDKLKQPTVYTTDGGLPATGADAIKCMSGGWKDAYLKYEKANTLTSNFSGPYMDSSLDSHIHPGFNICGTVSYRLSGFKPCLLNAPFDEKLIMRAFQCDTDYVGIHADLSAIEPTITAHYTEDPSLLKVFQKGFGDIYLDLALELFPNDKDLQSGYNPNVPIDKATKERFGKQRKIAKVIQLAVQYTGTGVTVARNLTKEGIATTKEEADGYVRAYWRKFKRVKEWNFQIKEVNKKQNMLRNVIGRIIRVPDPEYKDLSNRFIQSSAHDVLVEWVLLIDKLAKERHIDMRPLLIDCHDSTSWQVRKEDFVAGKQVFVDALQMLNKQLDLSVTIKAEIKKFHTFAGLKAEEV